MVEFDGFGRQVNAIMKCKGVRNVKIKKSDLQKISKYLIWGALAAVVLALLGYLGLDIWLASTQWLLVAAVLGLFGIYTKLS